MMADKADLQVDSLAVDQEKSKASELTERQRSQVREIFEGLYVIKKWRMMGINFLRGLAFGLGTFLGGTIVVAILVWLLSHSVNIFPGLSKYIEDLIKSLSR